MDAPRGLRNASNTCFMNALVQCCRSLLLRIPSHVLPASTQCPLARTLRPQSLREDDIDQWPCWSFIPIGPQRDACEVLEMCFDPAAPLHSSCVASECYGAVFRKLTSFSIERQLNCNHCAYAHRESQTQCFLRVEPHINTETSICLSLQEAAIAEFKCEACRGTGARQQIALGDLPPFLVVHVNKKAGTATSLPAESRVRISGTDLDRFAAVHHTGETPKNGHYTATVTTPGMAYYCDDSTAAPRPNLSASAWDNAYLIFFQKSCGDAPRAAPPVLTGNDDPADIAGSPCGDPHLATNAASPSGHCGGAPHPATNAASASGDSRAEKNEGRTRVYQTTLGNTKMGSARIRLILVVTTQRTQQTLRRRVALSAIHILQETPRRLEATVKQ